MIHVSYWQLLPICMYLYVLHMYVSTCTRVLAGTRGRCYIAIPIYLLKLQHLGSTPVYPTMSAGNDWKYTNACPYLYVRRLLLWCFQLGYCWYWYAFTGVGWGIGTGSCLPCVCYILSDRCEHSYRRIEKNNKVKYNVQALCV